MEFELRTILRIMWRWAWLLGASTLLGAIISYSATAQMPRTYSATATLMVGQVLQATNPNAADFSTSAQLAQTYVQLVNRQPLLQATSNALGMGEAGQLLAGQVSAGVLPNTQLIQITVVDTSLDRARIIADEVAHQLILQSPTPLDKAQDQRDAFLDQQLTDLQHHINDSQDQIKNLQGQLASENSARGVQDIQSQMGALQDKISTWQATYAQLSTSKVGRTNNLSVVEPANGSSAPVSPNVRMNVLTAAAVGFALALAAVLLIEYLDDTLKTPEDVNRAVKLPYLGAITARRLSRSASRLVTLEEPRSQAAEAYRVLRTTIQLALRHQAHPRLLITSSGVGEGKSTTASNLAISLAQTGKTVALCDLDLRRPTIHRLFEVTNDVGLSGLVVDPELPLESALIESAQPGLWLLPSGPVPTNPAELLASDTLADRISQLAQRTDVLIFDSPGVLSVADTRIIAGLANIAVLVADGKQTRRDHIRQAVSLLNQTDLPLLGVVLNRARDARLKGYAYYAAKPQRPRRWLRLPAILGALISLQR
jgi:non-specific protein-tyrosine kinase